MVLLERVLGGHTLAIILRTIAIRETGRSEVFRCHVHRELQSSICEREMRDSCVADSRQGLNDFLFRTSRMTLSLHLLLAGTTKRYPSVDSLAGQILRGSSTMLAQPCECTCLLAI